MPKAAEKERVKRWQERWAAANKTHAAWEKKYHCDGLEQYYEGHQWSLEDPERQKYVINLVFPTIEARMPSLLYYHPHFRVAVRQSQQDDQNSGAYDRAKLREDTLNTITTDPDVEFLDQTTLPLFESWFRFGVVEVGYTADFIDNPDFEKPMLAEKSDDPLLDKENKPVIDTRQKIVNREQTYVKWIPAWTFRVSANQNVATKRCDWAGYYEWHYPEDLKRNPRYKNTNNLKATGQIVDDDSKREKEEGNDNPVPKDMVKVVKIWSLRDDKQRVVFIEGAEKFLLEETFDIFPFEDLRFHKRPGHWYPLPPTFNWISPQDELNECRQMQGVHQRRANRRYGYQDGALEPDEIDKLENESKDMQLIKFNMREGMWVIEDAPLDASIWRNTQQSKDDFREISGEGGEQLGIADSGTATQANIIDVHARIRETQDRVKVADFLSRIGRKILAFVETKMALPLWIKTSVDPLAPDAQAQAAKVTELWKQIVISEEFGGLNYDVSVDVESLSPVTEDQERQNWTQVLMAVTNPQLIAIFAADQSQTLLRKTLKYYKITNEREITAIYQAMAAVIQAQQQAMAAKAGGTPGQTGPGPTPDNAAIASQIQAQLPAMGGIQ